MALAGTNTALTGAASQPQAPLSFVHAVISTVPMPISINHQGQFPVVTLSFNLAPGASLGTAVAITSATATKEIGMPASIEPTFQGTRGCVRKFAGERADADSGGDRDRLHRAGRAV